MTPTNIFTLFYNEGAVLTTQVTPYALNLLYLMLLVELGVLSITWMRGNDDIPDLAWRLIYLVFSTGFSYWWIVNAWTLGKIVLGSFHMLGQNMTGVADLTPSQFLDVAGQIFQILWNAPSSNRLIPNIPLAIAEFCLAIGIFFFLAIVAIAAMFTVATALLLIGPGSLFIAFLPCRFTTSLSENYFNWLMRTGAAILGFFIVLSACQHFATEWAGQLAATCGATTATLPSPILGAAPKMIPTMTCTAAIPVENLSILFVDAVLLVTFGLGIPILMAAFAGSGIHLMLEHLASAKYLGGAGLRVLSDTVGSLAHQVSKLAQSISQRSTLNSRMEAGAAAAARTSPTTPLTPPPSGGWNGRPAGPPITPPPAGPNNSGPGGSPAGLSYQPQPGRPGPQTHAAAVDITNLQGGNRG